MYACCSSLKARVKTLHGKWVSQMFLTDHSNQVRHTNWFSCHKRLCFHSFCINYLLFFEMYYIYKEQAYLAALKAANRLSQSNTIPDKTTWESFPHHVHFPMQQNYFQNDAFAERKPLPQFNVALHKRPGIRLSFEYTTTLLSGEGGEGRTGTATMLRKMVSQYTIFSTVLSKIVAFSGRYCKILGKNSILGP